MRISARGVALFGAVALAIANLGRIPAGVLAGRNAPFTLADLAAGLAWLVVLAAVLTRRRRFVLDNIVVTALAFATVAALSTALAIPRYRLGFGEAFEVVAFLFRWVLYFGWYPFVAWCLTPAESEHATRYVQSALLVICGFGIFQSAFIPEFGTRIAALGISPMWEYQGRRLVSTLLDPNFAGAMAMLALLPGVARANEGIRVRYWELAIPAVAIVLSASRSSVLALFVGVGVIVLARGVTARVLKIMAVGAVGVLIALPAIISFGESMSKFSLDRSAAQRLVTWQRASTLFMEHAWLGIGFNASRQAQQARGWVLIGGADTGFDGGLLFVMVMTGIVGAALYTMLLGRAVIMSRRIWRDSSGPAEDRAHATSTAAAVCALVVHALFSNTLLLPFTMQVLWVRFGRLAQISAELRRRRASVAIALMGALTACSPCFGAQACETDYRLRLEGSVRAYADGAPVPGAQINVAVRGAGGTETRSAITDGAGLWGVSVAGNCCDVFTVEPSVAAPGRNAYVVPPFTARATNHAGEALVLDAWLDAPFANLNIILRDREGRLLSGAITSFQQTDGIPITFVTADTVADGSGSVHLKLRSDRVGDAIGTFTVSHPSLSQPYRLPGLTIAVGYRYELPRVVTMVVSGPPFLPATGLRWP